MAMEWLYTMRRPDGERTAPPVLVRRGAAVLAVALYPLSLLLLKADIPLIDPLGPIPYVIGMVLVVGVWLAAFVIVYEFRRRLAQARDEDLDERERAIRDEAYLISYRLLGGALALAAVWALVGAPLVAGSREVSLDVVLDVAATLVIASVVLPSAVVAWRDTDRDDPEDEDPVPVVDGPAAGRAG